MIIPRNQLAGPSRTNPMDLMIETCLFCGQLARQHEPPLGQHCNCVRRSHLNCLIRHIQFNRSSYCETCLAPYQNVQIIYPDRSCARWLREDAATREAAIHVLSLLFLIVYLEYLSLLQLAVRYQSMLAIERYLLQLMMYFFLYVSVLLFILLLMFLAGSYVTFRRTTGFVNVIPTNPTMPMTSFASQPSQFAPFRQTQPKISVVHFKRRIRPLDQFRSEPK